MAARILLHNLRPHPIPIGIGLGLSSALLIHSTFSYSSRKLLLRCDASPSFSKGLSNYEKNANVPVTRGGHLNPNAVKQISAGSICGLLGGLAVSTFSKSLAFLIGLVVLGAQALEFRGIHIIPYGRLQSWFKNTDVRGALQDNIAFKVCFGVTFCLATFAEF